MDLAQNLARSGVELSYEQLYLGMRDAMSTPDSSQLSEATIKRMLQAFQADVMAAQQAKRQAQMEAAMARQDSFLAQNAQREAVKTTESGLQYEVLQAGEGESPGPDAQVKVHYEGRLLNGEIFDSSYARGEPATFGVGQVISGWTEALQLMKPGAKYRLYIPSKLAYGARGAGQEIRRRQRNDSTLRGDVDRE